MTTTTAAAPLRLLCIREQWGIYCGAVAIASAADLPQKSAHKVRELIRRSRWPGFLVADLADLADQANRNGVTELPISIYRPGHHKGQRWQHQTITTA